MKKPMWWFREMSRFNDGMYTCPPWKACPKCVSSAPNTKFDPLPDIEMHALHMCLHDTKLLAYTKSDHNGERDIQTPIKPGKYVNTYYPHLKPEQVAFYASLLGLVNNDSGILFARTADEIETVYLTGPPSCMSHKASVFNSKPVHPVRAYAGPDLAVAYVNGKADGNGKCSVAARVLTWPEKKIYSRVYGDGGAYSGKLTTALRKEGFVEGTLYGARLSIIRHDALKRHESIVPYVDGCTALQEENGFLVLRGNGNISAQPTNGVSRPPTKYCERCAEEYIETGNVIGIRKRLCATCGETQIVLCERHNEEVLRIDMRIVVRRDGGQLSMCHECARVEYTECRLCNVMFENGVCAHDTESQPVCVACRNDITLYAGDCLCCKRPVQYRNVDKRRTHITCKACSYLITWKNKAKEQNMNLDPELAKKAQDGGFNPIEYQLSLAEIVSAVQGIYTQLA